MRSFPIQIATFITELKSPDVGADGVCESCPRFSKGSQLGPCNQKLMRGFACTCTFKGKAPSNVSPYIFAIFATVFPFPFLLK